MSVIARKGGRLLLLLLVRVVYRSSNDDHFSKRFIVLVLVAQKRLEFGPETLMEYIESVKVIVIE